MSSANYNFGYDQLSGSIAGFISYLNKTGIRGQKFKDRT
jgi:hypothetical protein